MQQMRFTRLILAGLLSLPLIAAIPEPIRVEGGLVTGTPGWGWGVREYLGVPFAAPPVGDLRWRPPQPVLKWQGVRAADRFSPACMQRAQSPNSGSWNRGLINTSEDCLYLNVWTPAASASDKLPVLVWIYGGGGVSGSTAEPIYDGNAIAKKGVVVVSMNYRLNIFGWFAHPELTRESPHHSCGNYGSKTGNPNGPARVNWPAYNPKNEFWLNIGDTTRLERFNSKGVAGSPSFRRNCGERADASPEERRLRWHDRPSIRSSWS